MYPPSLLTLVPQQETNAIMIKKLAVISWLRIGEQLVITFHSLIFKQGSEYE